MPAGARNRLLLPLAAVALLAVVVAIATCGGEDTPPTTPQADSPAAATKASGQRKSRRGDGEQDRGAKSVPVAGAPAPTSPGTVPVDDGFPFLDVEVVQHDGKPAANSTIVYALTAGTTTTSEPANVAVFEGACRLHVLRPGKYDVGAIDDAFAALALDVEVLRETPLRIVLPKPATVVLLADPPIVSDAAWTGTDLRIVAADEGTSFPGRGQHANLAIRGRMERDTARAEFSMPIDAAARIESDSPDVAAVPPTFVAPATVRLVRGGRYPVTLRLTIEPATASFSQDAALEVIFDFGYRALFKPGWSVVIPAGQTVGAVVREQVLVSTVANLPDGTIRWKGDGFVAGSQPFAGLATDASNTVDLTLRVAADAPRPDVRRSVEVSTTGGDGAGLPGQARVFVGNDEGVANVADLVPGVAETIKGPTATWAVAVRGSWASDPVRVDAGGGVSLLLRPGGSLVLDVKSRPPASLGELLLRRRDGGPILTDGGVLPQMQVRAELGTVLGPLPEGPVDFVLELMGENVGEVHATVKAGAKETLRVPSVAPR